MRLVGRVVAALTHPSPLRRAVTATLIALVLWLAAWTVSYLVIGEGALRGVMAARVPDDVLRSGLSLAATIFSWNLVFGVGAIVLSSLFALGPLSLGYVAPWWWALGYGVALGTNSFVLTVPGKLAPRIDILWQHIGAREILAYVLVAAALANVHVWRPRRWDDLTLWRVRALSRSRLGIPEVACLAGAVGLLIWSANVEAAGSSLSSNSAARVFVELTKPVVLVPRQHGSVRLIFLGPMREAVVIFDRAHEVEPSVGERVELVGELT